MPSCIYVLYRKGLFGRKTIISYFSSKLSAELQLAEYQADYNFRRYKLETVFQANADRPVFCVIQVEHGGK